MTNTKKAGKAHPRLSRLRSRQVSQLPANVPKSSCDGGDPSILQLGDSSVFGLWIERARDIRTREGCFSAISRDRGCKRKYFSRAGRKTSFYNKIPLSHPSNLIALVLRLGIHKKLDKHRGCVNTVSFNEGGEILVTCSDDRMIMLWDWDRGLNLLEFYSGHSKNVFHAQMLPYTKSANIVSCAGDGEVRLAEILEGGQVATTLLGQHEGRAMKIATAPGSSHIFFSCGQDGVLQLFDLRTRSAIKLLVCKSFKHNSDYTPSIHLYAIAIDPRNPNLFAVAGSDEYARLYDIRKSKWDSSTDSCKLIDCFCPIHVIGDPQVGITGLAFSNQSELLASYNDELIYLFSKDQGLGANPVDINGGSCVRTEPQVYWGHRNSDTLKGVSFFGPNCEYVLSGSDCGRIFVWKKRGGELLRVMAGDKLVVNCIEPHPYATMFASSGVEKDVKVWTPNAVERALPVNIDEFMPPARVDYCVITSYDGEEDGYVDDPEGDGDVCDSDDFDKTPVCYINS